MTQPYVIGEVAQGYEGDPATARLLVRAAAAGKADAVKFQIVYADDLASPGYQYYDLFKSLEMSTDQWLAVRQEACARGLHFVADVFGALSLELARQIDVDAVKLHSTTFFDRDLVDAVLDLGKPVYMSLGGITIDELKAALDRCCKHKAQITLLHGFQAEPTPIENNNLARIPVLRAATSCEVGFMDHAHGTGPDAVALSVLALGLGVRVFEKHITLDHAMEMEDYVSALGPTDFAAYVSTLRRLSQAVGTGDLRLTEAEQAYRGRALKRVLAARRLAEGATLTAQDLRLARPAQPGGLFDPQVAIGRRLKHAVAEGQSIAAEDLT